MSTKNQLTGGSFQDVLGNLLANGYLLMELSQDAQTNTGIQIAAGTIVKIPLDASGNIVTSPAYSVWPNDVLSPANTFYNVSAYKANGQLVWGPNAQQVFSTPSPFNVGVWVPGAISVIPGNQTVYDIAANLPGAFFANQVEVILALERPVRFATSMFPSTAVCNSTSTGSVVFNIAKNGTNFATLTFHAGNPRGVYFSTGPVSFATGDILTITAPSSTDLTLNTIGLILSGVIVS